MKPISALLLLITLAACGADGMPEAPTAHSSSQTGLSVTGCVQAGIKVGAPTAQGPVRC